MIIKNPEWSKPRKVLLQPIISSAYSRQEADHKFRIYLKKWFFLTDVHICCLPFQASDNYWYTYIQERIKY